MPPLPAPADFLPLLRLLQPSQTLIHIRDIIRKKRYFSIVLVYFGGNLVHLQSHRGTHDRRSITDWSVIVPGTLKLSRLHYFAASY